MRPHYRIELLTEINPQMSTEISLLIKQHTPAADLSVEYLKKMVSNPSTSIFIATNNGHIVGIATMIFYHKLNQYKAFVEDVVVDMAHRRKGIGEALIKTIIQKAKDMRLDTIHLTSRPDRIAANILYQKLGFKIYKTNYYKYEISPPS